MIKLENVSKSYGNNVILNNINLEFNSGLVYILGRSGSGKSSLLNIIGTLDKQSKGFVYYNDIDLNSLSKKSINSYRRDKIGFVFQDKNLFSTLNVYENIAYPLKIKNVDEEAIRKKVIKVLKTVNLKGYELRDIKTLSGGELQRVAIARALIKDPEIILADEITSSLDNTNKNEIMDLIVEISKSFLVIMVTHDKEIVNNYPSTTYVLENNKIIQTVLDNKTLNRKQKEVDNYKFNWLFHIKDALKYFKNNIIKTITATLFLVVIATILAFTLSLNLFSANKMYQNFSNKYNLEYITFGHNNLVSNTNFVTGSLFKEEQPLDNTFWGFPLDSSYNNSYSNVIFINNNFNYSLLSGNLPINNNEVVITDYLSEDLNVGDPINVLNKEYFVSGVIETNYKKHLNPKSKNELMAFKEQKEFLNSIFMYENDYLMIHEEVDYYYENIVFNNENNYIKLDNILISYNSSLNDNEILLSNELMNYFNLEYTNNVLINFVKYKNFRKSLIVTGVNNSEGIVLSETLYKQLNEERFGYLAITSVSNFNEIDSNIYYIFNETTVKPHNIVNTIFNLKDYSNAIYIISTLFLLIFAIIILYIIFNNDKKTIGIKKSLGVSNIEIYTYYSTILSVIGVISFIISILLTFLTLYIFDYNFNYLYNYVYLKLNYHNFLFLLVFNLLFLNIISIPYTFIYFRKNIKDLI